METIDLAEFVSDYLQLEEEGCVVTNREIAEAYAERTGIPAEETLKQLPYYTNREK